MDYKYIHDEIGLKVQQFERKKEAGFQQAHPSWNTSSYANDVS